MALEAARKQFESDLNITTLEACGIANDSRLARTLACKVLKLEIKLRRARATACKRGDSMSDTRSVAAMRIATIKTKSLAHKKVATQQKQVKNSRTRVKKAVQQERPCTPRTADANRKKIVADTSRNSIKKVDNAMSTAEKWHRFVIEHYKSGH